MSKFRIFLVLMICVLLGVVYIYYYLIRDQTNQPAPVTSVTIKASPTVTPKVSNVDWNTEISSIREVLGPNFLDNKVEETGKIAITRTADVTGDGVDEALVYIGSGGAYLDYETVMMMKNGKPAVAKFKEDNGSTGPEMFIEGASVGHAAEVKFVPEKNAIISESWSAGSTSGTKQDCEISAYIWNASTNAFDFNAALSDQTSKSICN